MSTSKDTLFLVLVPDPPRGHRGFPKDKTMHVQLLASKSTTTCRRSVAFNLGLGCCPDGTQVHPIDGSTEVVPLQGHYILSVKNKSKKRKTYNLKSVRNGTRYVFSQK